MGAVSVAAVLMGTHATDAFAELVGTSVGPVDRSCVHEVPNGGDVDGETGEVTVDGGVVVKYAACTAAASTTNSPVTNAAGPAVSFTGKGGAGGGTSEWYQFSWANAISVGGLKQFNEFITYMAVPPNGPSDQSVMYLFPSFENFDGSNPSNCPFGSGCGNFYSIIQPILEWGNNTISGTGPYWIAQAMEVYGAPGTKLQVATSPICYVQANDSLTAILEQVSASPDKWGIWIQDNTNGCYTYNYFTPPSSWPKYNTVQGGVLEAYGNAAETTSLPTCADLPTTNNEFFQVYQLSQAGPSWSSYNDVHSRVSWQGFFNDPLGFSPTNCSWTGAVGTIFSSFGTWLLWQY